MKIRNMENDQGLAIPNQFIITNERGSIYGNFLKRETFQSYGSTIAVKTVWEDGTKIELDEDKWNYSVTTGKYRNQFLGEKKAETQKKIDSGEYTLTNLN